MKRQFVILAVCVLVYINAIAQPPVKKLVFTGYKYEYEKEKREGEIILSGTYPDAMTKEYKKFRSDSIKIVKDSLSRIEKFNPKKSEK